MGKRILMVDDDPNILSASKRLLYKEFHLTTAGSGEEGIVVLKAKGPFAVVVSDYRMPKMDGIQFLTKVRQSSPDTVRILLTGQIDLQAAIDAVNEGNIFRLLIKPCSTQDFQKALKAAMEQYRLVTAERELLEETLRGSVRSLIDVLSIINPLAFQKASRLRHPAKRLATRLRVVKLWEVELAALLSQIGCVTVPKEILEKKCRGDILSADETETYASHPQAARNLLANIPRLEGIAEGIAYELKQFDGGGFPRDGKNAKEIPLLGRILKVVLDYDEWEQCGKPANQCIEAMRRYSHYYDPEVLAALEAELMSVERGFIVRLVGLRELRSGMVLAEELKDDKGEVVLPKGYEISYASSMRLTAVQRHGAIVEPVKILEPVKSTAP
jgi:response regulator RpfG family c-di-GMP phosphodiesterase